jgi:hypothetical protein
LTNIGPAPVRVCARPLFHELTDGSERCEGVVATPPYEECPAYEREVVPTGGKVRVPFNVVAPLDFRGAGHVAATVRLQYWLGHTSRYRIRSVCSELPVRIVAPCSDGPLEAALRYSGFTAWLSARWREAPALLDTPESRGRHLEVGGEPVRILDRAALRRENVSEVVEVLSLVCDGKTALVRLKVAGLR